MHTQTGDTLKSVFFQTLRQSSINSHSFQMRDYVEKKCKCLTNEQRQQLAVTVDDIVFMVPEDVSVVFDEQGEC